MTLQQLGTFRILKKLGEGGMGAVYLAEDTAAQRKVALKVLPTQLFSQTEFIKRFYREARATGKLNHPNIVSAYTVGEEQGLHYYVMEYCPGRSLDRLIAERGAIPWREATGIILQVAAGLQHAHERNFIHRDIKPHNVILGDDGVAKILDMGLTKNIGDVEQSFNTQSGAMLGTPHYIAPEQARGESSIDGRVDIYSLGATYFHLVTGKTPYNGPTAMAIIARHMTEAPPDASAVNSHVPHAVAYVIKRMMAKSPDDRHRDCAQLIQDLEQLRDGHVPATMASAVDGATETMAAIQAPPPSRPSGGQTVADEQRSGVDRRVNDRRGDRDTAPREPEKRTAFLIAAAAATVLLAIVVGILIGRRGTQSPPAAPSPAAASPAPAGIPVEETSQQPPAVSIPEPAKPPPPVTPLPAQAPAAAGEWVNLLPLVDPRRDTRNGQWFADNGTLRSAVSHYTTIQFPYRPPEEYDFRVTFTVQEGTPDFNQMIVKDGRCFHYMVPGVSNQVIGFARMHGRFRNPATRDRQLEPRRRYTSEVQVRRDRIRALLDGEQVIELTSGFSDFTPAPQTRISDETMPGLLAHNCVVIVHSAEIRDVTGKGRMAR